MSKIKKIATVYSLLSTSERRGFFKVLTLLIFTGLIEVVGLASILALIYVATNPSAVSNLYDIKIIGPYLEHYKPINLLGVLTATVFLAFLFKSIFFVWFSNYQSRFSFKIARSFMDRQLNFMFSKPVLEFNNQNSNKTVQDAITISMEFATSILQPGLLIFSEIVVGFFICVSIAIYDWRVFFGIVLLIGPWILLFFRTVRSKITKLGYEKNEIRPVAFKFVFAAIHGIDFVKITKSEGFFKNKILKSFDRMFLVMRRLIVLEAIPLRVIEMAAISTIAALIIYTLYFQTDTIELLSLIALFATAAYRLMPSLNRIVTNTVRMRSAGYVLDRLNLSQIRNDDTVNQGGNLPFLKYLALEKVHFTYPNKSNYALNNIDLVINKGDMIGIIGLSGGGKSTLLKVILGLIEPDSGIFKVDGTVMKKEKYPLWFEKLGYVEQNIIIFDGSIAENVAFGQNSIDMNRVLKCLEMAQLKKFVDLLPNGIHANAGEFGKLFSGGQKQRLGIARALYRKAEILVFDEATSALDKETESQVLETIQFLNNDGMTVLIVSHNTKSLSHCNRIIEIENGSLKNRTYREGSDEWNSMTDRNE